MRIRHSLLLFVMAAGLSSPSAWAEKREPDYAPYLGCFNEAAQRQNLPVELLIAVAEKESGFNPKAVNRANANASTDYGMMQINSWWIPKLEKMGIPAETLMDACTNIHVGAWIMAQEVSRHGWSWRGIGAYNANSDHKRLNYAKDVLRRWQSFTQRLRG